MSIEVRLHVTRTTHDTTLELWRLAVKHVDRLDAILDHSDGSANAAFKHQYTLGTMESKCSLEESHKMPVGPDRRDRQIVV